MKAVIKPLGHYLNNINLVCMLYAVYALREVHIAFDRTEYSQYGHLFSLALPPLAVVAGILYLLRKRYMLFDKRQGYLLILPISFMMLSLHSYTGSIHPFLHMVPVMIFLLMLKRDKICVFNYFYWIVQINNVVSCLLFLFYKLSINIGFQFVPRYESVWPQIYQKWGLFAILHVRKYGSNGQLCGIFSEPGPLGTICALLFIARFRYSKKWEKILLLLTIFCTYSLAGWLLILLFAVAYNLKLNIKNIAFAVFGIMVIFLIPHIDFGDARLNAFASRFAIVDGRLAGDDRTNDEFDINFNNYLSFGPAFFGHGVGYKFKGNIIQASYKQIIVEYGLFGFLVLISFWIIIPCYVSCWDKNCILFIFLFLASIYGRPRQIMEMFGYVILVGGINWMQWKCQILRDRFCAKICSGT